MVRFPAVSEGLLTTEVLTCGLPGSGKSTLAKRLEQEVPALRLTADEWLHELYPTITTSEAEEGTVRSGVSGRSRFSGCRRALESMTVVMDARSAFARPRSSAGPPNAR
jgi:predicted kinase